MALVWTPLPIPGSWVINDPGAVTAGAEFGAAAFSGAQVQGTSAYFGGGDTTLSRFNITLQPAPGWVTPVFAFHGVRFKFQSNLAMDSVNPQFYIADAGEQWAVGDFVSPTVGGQEYTFTALYPAGFTNNGPPGPDWPEVSMDFSLAGNNPFTALLYGVEVLIEESIFWTNFRGAREVA